MAAMDDDRHPPLADAPVACPFVALEDDRDRRSERPDPRHRCFAEMRPAPRALAHQQAYCLSPSFPACPTFQDWAHREAARVAAGGPAATPEPPPAPGRSRDWNAPPPWTGAAGAAAAAAGGAPGAAGAGGPDDDLYPDQDHDAGAGRSAEGGLGSDVEAPPFLVARSRPAPSPEPPAPRPAAPSPEATSDGGFWGEPPDRDRPWEQPVDEDADDQWPPSGAAAVGAATSAGRRGPARPGRPAGGHVRPAAVEEHGPSWEKPRRVEAYPNLRTRMGLPRLSGLWLAVAALLVAAIALFFLPAILAPKSSPGGAVGASPSASAAPTATSAPTVRPGSSGLTYTVKEGDTLSKIAAAHGVTIEQIMSANPSMKDPNKIAVGDQLVIPAAAPSVVEGASPSATP